MDVQATIYAVPPRHVPGVYLPELPAVAFIWTAANGRIAAQWSAIPLDLWDDMDRHPDIAEDVLVASYIMWREGREHTESLIANDHRPPHDG